LGRAFQITPFTKYGVIFHKGPWYQFIVDYAILSPVILLLSLVAMGYLLSKSDLPNKQVIIIAAVVFFFNALFITTVSMNVRYILYMDWLMALVLAVAIPLWVSEIQFNLTAKRVCAILLLLFLGIFNYSQYHKLFVEHQSYDTINHTLLTNGEILPKWYMEAQIQEERIKLLNTPLTPEASALLQQSYELNDAKDFDGVIANCKAILQLNPYHAETYNLLCVAYNEKGMYHYAIEACNMALYMAPDYKLAKNNLAWAMEQIRELQK